MTFEVFIFFINITPLHRSTHEMWVLFVVQGRNEVVIVEKSKTIYCPKCGRRVATWDGKTSINPIGHCRKCNKRVVFKVETQETIIKDVPIRATSSGKTFY